MRKTWARIILEATLKQAHLDGKLVFSPTDELLWGWWLQTQQERFFLGATWQEASLGIDKVTNKTPVKFR